MSGSVLAGWAGRLIAGLALLATLVLLAGPHLLPFETFYVRSGSMAPGIPVGSLVVGTEAQAADLDVGDVIIFERPDHQSRVVHRIVAVEPTPTGRAFSTQGDANSSPDGWLVPAQGTGLKAVRVYPRLGFMVGWLNNAASRQGAPAAATMIGAVWALIAIWRCEGPDAVPCDAAIEAPV